MHLLTWVDLDGGENESQIWLKQDANVSKYAILSHRWGDANDEVSFEDMLAGRQQNKKGYTKLLGCCKQAQKDGFHHVWIDTCCINKASSAELSEAIASMFTYYQQSKVCYAFLEDVLIDSSDARNLHSSSFPQSAWFTRGWTLQELIAPGKVHFFDREWSFLGQKTDDLLSSVIESVTGVDKFVLGYPDTIQVISIAKRMSWAARRKTTRIEDRAYSLMGIFGVYMSPLYGEGHHAFIRLQEEIIRTSNDHTVFAWTSPPIPPFGRGFQNVSTMLALSPDQFKYSSNFMPLSHSKHNTTLNPSGSRLDYASTNAGLSIRLPLVKVDEVEGLYAAFLACTDAQDRVPSAIFLRTTADSPSGHFWRTTSNNGPIELSKRRWFPNLGREGIHTNDIYIMPRFTSVSGDNIEPLWTRVNITSTSQKQELDSFSRTLESDFKLLAEISRELEHVPDPSFRDLAFLRNAQKLISTTEPHEISRKIRVKWHLSSNIPLPRNKYFSGRVAVLQKLNDAFFPSDRDIESQDRDTTCYAISGCGGIGKTQVAVEFSYNCLQNHLFGAVFWISATTTARMYASFREIGSHLGLVEQETPNEAIVREVILWLSKFNQHADVLSSSDTHSSKWLLVFDDVQDASLLYPFWPSSGFGCVLVTSRSVDVGRTLRSEVITLEPFSVLESSNLFRDLTRKEWNFAVASERLGGLPIAIAQLSQFILEAALSSEVFLCLFDHENKKLDRMELHEMLWLKDPAALWSLHELSSSSLAVLKVASFLHPDLIQISILTPSATVPLREYPQNKYVLYHSRRKLSDMGLIFRSQEHNGLRVHRLMQDCILARMDPAEYQRALSTAIHLVSFAWEERELPNTKVSNILRSHVAWLTEFVSKFTDLEDTRCIRLDFAKLISYL